MMPEDLCRSGKSKNDIMLTGVCHIDGGERAINAVSALVTRPTATLSPSSFMFKEGGVIESCSWTLLAERPARLKECFHFTMMSV